MVKLFNRFAHSAGPGVENIVGTVWSHLRGKVARRGLKNRRPGVQKRKPRGVKFRPPGGPSGASWAPGRPEEGALALLAGLRAPRGRFPTDSSSFPGDSSSLPGDSSCILASWGRLGPLLGRPRRLPARLRDTILGVCLERESERLQNLVLSLFSLIVDDCF